MKQARHLTRRCALFTTLLTLSFTFQASASSPLSEPFSQFTSQSEIEIQYPDVNAVLDISVIELGASNRELADRPLGSTGTRLKKRINRLTALESNRVYFENFDKKNYRKVLDDVTESLVALPNQASLKFSTKMNS